MEEKTIKEKYISVLNEVSNPVRDTTGYNYKYAQLNQVMDIVQKACKANECAVIQSTSITPENGYTTPRWILTTSISDGKDTAVLDVRELVQTDDAQVKGSYETYMRRYALMTAFGLAPEDDDGSATALKMQEKITEKQALVLKSLCEDKGVDVGAVLKQYKRKSFDEFTAANYTNLLQRLKGGK